MANNRMNLINTATGQIVQIATHFAAKWRVEVNLKEALDAAFRTELENFPAAWGSTAWAVGYETYEPHLDADLRNSTANWEGWRTDPPSALDVCRHNWWWNKPADGGPPIVFQLDCRGDVIYDAALALRGQKTPQFDPSAWPGRWAPCVPPRK